MSDSVLMIMIINSIKVDSVKRLTSMKVKAMKATAKAMAIGTGARRTRKGS